jgi:carbon monoxide dehydrogenase subunit G
MDMQASRQLGVTQQQAWDALNDPEVLKLCIPGCDKVEATGENQYAVGVSVKIGPVSAKFAGKITLSDINPPESYTITFDGQGGAAGFGKGNAQVTLTPNEGGCELAYTVHAQVGGKVAQLGQRLIDGAAKGMAEDFFKRFDNEMQRRFPPPAAAAEPVVADAAAAGVAASTPQQDAAPVQMARDPEGGLPGWVWVAGVVVAGVVIWLLAR